MKTQQPGAVKTKKKNKIKQNNNSNNKRQQQSASGTAVQKTKRVAQQILPPAYICRGQQLNDVANVDDNQHHVNTDYDYQYDAFVMMILN